MKEGEMMELDAASVDNEKDDDENLEMIDVVA
jgi:hypothetical protein